MTKSRNVKAYVKAALRVQALQAALHAEIALVSVNRGRLTGAQYAEGQHILADSNERAQFTFNRRI